MDLHTQERIKAVAEEFGPEALVVVLGHADPGGASLMAETVTSGDPTYAGALAGVPLGLSVYHVLEPEVKAAVEPSQYRQHLAMMEMAMESEEALEVIRRTRLGGS